MIHRRVNPGGVVEQDGADFRIIQPEFGKHDGDVVVHELVEHRFFFAESEHCHAFDLSLEHAAYTGRRGRQDHCWMN